MKEKGGDNPSVTWWFGGFRYTSTKGGGWSVLVRLGYGVGLGGGF